MWIRRRKGSLHRAHTYGEQAGYEIASVLREPIPAWSVGQSSSTLSDFTGGLAFF